MPPANPASRREAALRARVFACHYNESERFILGKMGAAQELIRLLDAKYAAALAPEPSEPSPELSGSSEDEPAGIADAMLLYQRLNELHKDLEDELPAPEGIYQTYIERVRLLKIRLQDREERLILAEANAERQWKSPAEFPTQQQIRQLKRMAWARLRCEDITTLERLLEYVASVDAAALAPTGKGAGSSSSPIPLSPAEIERVVRATVDSIYGYEFTPEGIEAIIERVAAHLGEPR